MATKKKRPEPAGRKTQRLNVWLSPEQIEFLKLEKDGPSAAVRALITEAINLDKLTKSAKGGAKKKARK